MKVIKTYGKSAEAAKTLIESIESRSAVSTAKVEDTVKTILAAVRKRGDAAVEKYATKFDSLDGPIRVTPEEMQEAWDATAPALREAMTTAQANIRAFAEAQRPEEWLMQDSIGLTTGQIVRPLASVGCYVPGGRFPLPSTLLMTVTPAQVAGVPRTVVCSPKPARETLAAAHLAGLHSSKPVEFYRIGGAQAIAALAYGTQTIARVEKIVGPGNLYVTAAKRLVQNDCGIDMPAGPTEIGILSEKGSPAGLAADLVAQAEHDPEALAVFVTPNEQLAKAVFAETQKQAKALTTNGNPLAQQSLAANGFVFVTKTITQARDLINRLAFEHLSVDALADLSWIQNAGSVFVGRFSPQSMGDYISGPNHVLPTGRAGRIRGGLSIFDFVKIITIQQYSAAALKVLGPQAIVLAEAEGLIGHAQSVRVKLKGGKR
jgi:histidinol dehydrogenase